MTKREKIELHPTVKAKPVEEDENAIQLKEEMQITIREIKDITTANGNKVIAKVEDEKEKVYSVFMNRTSINKLIESFGDDDSLWIGKMCKLTIEQCPEPFQKQKMILFNPIQ